MSTAQQFLITGTVAGISVGVFDTKSGGDPSAEVAKHRGGGMGKEQAFAGLPTFADLTIGRRYDKARDQELYRRLVALIGPAGDSSITVQPLDVNGAPFGRPYTFTGVLMGATDPEVDSESSAVSTFSLMFSITDRA